MTIGIYKLSFDWLDKVYIGQSINIEERYKKHLWNLRTGNSSVKLQQAYNLYGIPKLDILAECLEAELNSLENEAIEIFNSFVSGLNGTETSDTMPVLVGTANGNSKYSEDQYICVAEMLCEKIHTAKYIAKATGVSEYVVKHISKCENNSWLSTDHPVLWAKLQELKGARTSYLNSSKALGIVYPNIVSPEGVIHQVDNVNAFAREHGLAASALHNVLTGKRKSHKQWKLA